MLCSIAAAISAFMPAAAQEGVFTSNQKENCLIQRVTICLVQLLLGNQLYE